MADNNATETIKGAMDQAKGKIKETVGSVTGNDDLAEEGRAQKTAGGATREAGMERMRQERAQAEKEESRDEDVF
ncbi:CsbD family protein [Gordonia sp. X0973]|uniref:CsbD family protein n=1 Tax=Gordonia sp. X0973 TaxID=2742602 RepID=UPI000F546508|nr:CsbD family protein [Gordonia sp. X0973]QKT08331.1 CsbD family protein [Gordonia sp. X0973]